MARRSSPSSSATALRLATTLLPALLLAAAILLAWTAGSQRLGRTLLPSPGAVVAALGELAATGDLGSAAGQTATVALWGIGISVAIALPLAWLIVHSRSAAAALEPYIALSQAIPAIAVAPLLALWFGYGLGTTALLAAVVVFFPLVIATTLGLRSLDPDVVGAARVDGAGTWRLLRHLEVPLAAPQTLAGLRAGVALAMTGAIVGEFVLGGRGLGQLLVAQRDRADTAGMFATLVVVAAISVTGYLLVRIAETAARHHAQT